MVTISSSSSIRTSISSYTKTDEQLFGSPFSPSNTNDKVKLRVGGRGGAGSRPRVLVSTCTAGPFPRVESPTIQIQPVPIGQVRQIVKVRVSGRGGAGSKPRRAITGGPVRVNESSVSTTIETNAKPTTVRSATPYELGAPARIGRGMKGKVRVKGKGKAKATQTPLPADVNTAPSSTRRKKEEGNGALERKSSLSFGGSTVSFARHAASYASTSDITNSPTIMSSPGTSPLSEFLGSQMIPESEVRRRQFDKLQRTLGDRIPPERIYHGLANKPSHVIPGSSTNRDGETSQSKKLTKTARRSSVSMATLGHFASSLRPPSSDSSSYASTSTQQTTSESNYSNNLNTSSRPSINDSYTDASSISTMAFANPSQVCPTGRKPSPPPFSSAADDDIDEPEYASEDTLASSPADRLKSSAHKENIVEHAVLDARPESPFVDSLMPFQSVMTPWDPVNTYGSAVVRKEKGWSGEWNHSDIQYIIAKLRLL